MNVSLQDRTLSQAFGRRSDPHNRLDMLCHASQLSDGRLNVRS